MIGIHPVHRRLAEIHVLADQLGGYHKLPYSIQLEYTHCIKVNAELVQKLDSLKQLAFHAYEVGDMEWHNEICAKIDQVEATML